MTEGEDVDDEIRVVLPAPDPDLPPIVIDKGDGGPVTVSSPTSIVLRHTGESSYDDEARVPMYSIKADAAAIVSGDMDQMIVDWYRSMPPHDDVIERYLNTPSMWEPDKPADPETMRQAWADAHDEFQRRMRGEGLRIDPTEGATDD